MRQRLSDATNQLGHIVDAIAKTGYTDILGERLHRMEAEKSELAFSVAKEESSELPAITREHVLWWMGRVRDIDSEKPGYTKNILDTFVSKVTVADAEEGKHNICIEYNYKDDEGSISA